VKIDYPLTKYTNTISTLGISNVSFEGKYEILSATSGG
jgi:hypothetical protein